MGVGGGRASLIVAAVASGAVLLAIAGLGVPNGCGGEQDDGEWAYLTSTTSTACVQDSDCDDKNPCTKDRCVYGQCKRENEPDGTVCPDDGNHCTYDVCKDGACVHPKGCAPACAEVRAQATAMNEACAGWADDSLREAPTGEHSFLVGAPSYSPWKPGTVIEPNATKLVKTVWDLFTLVCSWTWVGRISKAITTFQILTTLAGGPDPAPTCTCTDLFDVMGTPIYSVDADSTLCEEEDGTCSSATYRDCRKQSFETATNRAGPLSKPRANPPGSYNILCTGTARAVCYVVGAPHPLPQGGRVQCPQVGGQPDFDACRPQACAAFCTEWEQQTP